MITDYVSKLVLGEVVPIQLVFLCFFLEVGCIYMSQNTENPLTLQSREGLPITAGSSTHDLEA